MPRGYYLITSKKCTVRLKWEYCSMADCLLLAGSEDGSRRSVGVSLWLSVRVGDTITPTLSFPLYLKVSRTIWVGV